MGVSVTLYPSVVMGRVVCSVVGGSAVVMLPVEFVYSSVISVVCMGSCVVTVFPIKCVSVNKQ